MADRKETLRLVDVTLVQNYIKRIQARHDRRLALASAAKLGGDTMTTVILVALANEDSADIYDLKQIVRSCK